MQWENQMATEIPPCNAHISDDTHQPPAWNQDTINMPPDFLQLNQKLFIILNMTELFRVFDVLLKIPIRG
jgi:hypothetical protein